MSSLNRRPTSGSSGHSHRLIFEPYPRQIRHLYQAPTDGSLKLPPLAMHSSTSYHSNAHSDYQIQFSPGLPSPPRSDCSRDYTPRRNSSQYQDAMAAPSQNKPSPPYAPRDWTSPAAHSLTPASIPSEVAMPSSYTPRVEYRQPTYYDPRYGSVTLPAPSQLLGAPHYGVHSSYQPHSTTQYYPVQPKPASSFSNHSSTSYLPSYPCASAIPHQSTTISATWQPPPVYNHLHEKPFQAYYRPALNRPTRSPSAQGGLPTEAWRRIFRYLTYAERLRLRSVNHFFHDTLVALEDHLDSLAHPDPADIEDKICLVATAENYRKHWAPSLASEARNTNRGRPRNDQRALIRTAAEAAQAGGKSAGRKKRDAEAASIGNLGCYHCYRVLPGEAFCREPSRYDANGIGRDTAAMGGRIAPRRYCLKCGIKKGFHLPDKYYERKVGVSIWVCRCGTINEDGVMHCEKCQNMCPFTSVERQRGDEGY